jgi:hypothetical protein
VLVRENNIGYRCSVEQDKGADLSLKKGEEIVTRRKSSTFVGVVCAQNPLRPEAVVLIKNGNNWQRRVISATRAAGCASRSEGGSEESRQKNMLMLSSDG